MSAESTTARSYGGWRRSRSLGLGRLDARQTLVVVGCVLVPLLVVAAGGPVSVALALAGAGGCAAGLVIAQWRGVLLLDAALAYGRWRWAVLRG
ncbi:MAG: hypothetical protein L0Y54_05135, partial [Sporichthyaceae bacterium]|nr:hypothetical protein [Sporichthyaceae bacterium]